MWVWQREPVGRSRNRHSDWSRVTVAPVSVPAVARERSRVQNVQTGCAVHPTSCSMCHGVFDWRWSGRALSSHSHLVPRSRMSGALPLHPLYAFMAWPGTVLPLLLPALTLFFFSYGSTAQVGSWPLQSSTSRYLRPLPTSSNSYISTSSYIPGHCFYPASCGPSNKPSVCFLRF
jgi:hypothetical protein